MKKEKKAAEVAVIENPKFTELISKSGIELTKAEAHVSAFHPKLAELSELSRPLSCLDKENPDHAKIARENRLKIVKVRTGSESIKDELKKALLAESNLIQSAFNLVKDACILTESEYEEIEKYQEKIAAQKREELKQARIALLEPFEVDTTYLPLDIMDDEQFQKLLSSEKEKYEAVLAARAKAEADRIDAERLAEEKRLAEIEAEKKRQAERDAENERLKKEAQIREAELAKERAEAARIAAEKQAEIDKANAEADRIKKELEAKQLEEEKERQRIIAEQEEKEARAKALLKAPDQEKVKVFFGQFKQLQFPELQSEQGKKMSERVNEALSVVKKLIIEDSKTLL